jgi:two-component system response regulator AtoC
VVLCQDGKLRVADLPSAVTGGSARPLPPASGPSDLSLRQHAGAAQAGAIREALQRSGGNRRRAAELLGISVRTLFYKIKELGIAE